MISKYRNLIVKVLQQSSGKKLTAEQVADALITRIEDVEEAISSMGPALLVTPPPAHGVAVTSLVPPAPTGGYQDAPTDVFQRIDAPPSAEMVERYTVDQLANFAKNEMPSLIQVQPPGFDAPFTIKKFIDIAGGNLGFVRIVYQQEGGEMITESGQRIGPTLQITTTDKKLDADEMTENVRAQANATYSKTKRVLVPQRPPITGSLGDLRNGLSADAAGPAFNPNMTDEQVIAAAQQARPVEWDTPSAMGWKNVAK